MDNSIQKKIDPGEPENKGSWGAKISIFGNSNNPRSVGMSGTQTHLPPWRFLIVTFGGIFLAEIVPMLVIMKFSSLPYYLQILLAASIMIAMIFPLVYYLSLHPLFSYIEKFKQADIELRKSEEHLRRVNRALTVLNGCNQVLVRAENENELLQRMCEVLVNTGEYRMAWVGVAEQDLARSIRPVAQIGFEEGYLELAKISWADNERGRGPTGTAVREGVTQVNQNFLTNPKMEPWRASALSRGYQSSIALPLKIDDSTYGALTIYSAAPDAFDTDEVHLLNELADDLAFGINALHVRAEHKLAEEKLRKAYDQLELRVQERTEELRKVISELEKEIANRKQAEATLVDATREAENNRAILEAMVQQMPVGIILTNAAGEVAKNNTAMDRIWRREMLPSENIENHGYIAYHPDGQEYQRDEWPLSRSLQNGEEIIGEEMTIVRGDGSKGIVHVSSAPIKDKNGQLIAGVVVDVDITERKKVEEALRASEEKYRLLLEHAPTAIYEIDFRGPRFKSVNEAMCQITGFSAEELLSKNPLDFLDEESKKRFQERAKKLLAGEQVDDHIEYRMIDKDGSKRWIILNVKLTYKDGINDGAQVVGHDVTERIQMEAELRAANEELTRFNKAMVGRELRMIELKEEVNQLCGQSGQPPRYPLEFEKEEK